MRYCRRAEVFFWRFGPALYWASGLVYGATLCFMEDKQLRLWVLPTWSTSAQTNGSCDVQIPERNVVPDSWLLKTTSDWWNLWTSNLLIIVVDQIPERWKSKPWPQKGQIQADFMSRFSPPQNIIWFWKSSFVSSTRHTHSSADHTHFFQQSEQLWKIRLHFKGFWHLLLMSFQLMHVTSMVLHHFLWDPVRLVGYIFGTRQELLVVCEIFLVKFSTKHHWYLSFVYFEATLLVWNCCWTGRLKVWKGGV